MSFKVARYHQQHAMTMVKRALAIFSHAKPRHKTAALLKLIKAYRDEVDADLKLAKLNRNNREGLKYAQLAEKAAIYANNPKKTTISEHLVALYRRFWNAKVTLQHAHGKHAKRIAQQNLNRARIALDHALKQI